MGTNIDLLTPVFVWIIAPRYVLIEKDFKDTLPFRMRKVYHCDSNKRVFGCVI